jgi:hypothetical protein
MNSETRVTMRNRDGYAGLDGRYWARTSDPQLVEGALPAKGHQQMPNDAF